MKDPRLGAGVLLVAMAACDSARPSDREAVRALVQRMNAEVLEARREAAEAFTRRRDFEELRECFGAEVLDSGTPMGFAFEASLRQMTAELEGHLDQEPAGRDFFLKAGQRVRRFGQWWELMRIKMAERREKLAGDLTPDGAFPDGPSRSRAAQALFVLDETIRVVRRFEEIIAAYSRRIEAYAARA
jgi:hypothetical protein